MSPPGRVLWRQGINVHTYADDAQLYVSPDDTRPRDVCFNFLRLNQEQTAVLIIPPKRIGKIRTSLDYTHHYSVIVLFAEWTQHISLTFWTLRSSGIDFFFFCLNFFIFHEGKMITSDLLQIWRVDRTADTFPLYVATMILKLSADFIPPLTVLPCVHGGGTGNLTWNMNLHPDLNRFRHKFSLHVYQLTQKFDGDDFRFSALSCTETCNTLASLRYFTTVPGVPWISLE